MSDSAYWKTLADEWRTETAPWRLDGDVLQDLLLSRIIVEIANDSELRERMVLHGGTCLQKIWFDKPQRYSEDLDFLCVKPWHLPFVMRRVKRIVKEAGLADAHYSFRGYPALLGSGMGGHVTDLKIDFNPTPKAAKRARRNRGLAKDYEVQSKWYSGKATRLPCASAVDILATKISAVMTRKKARDLTDLCTGMTIPGVNLEDVVAVYHEHYSRNSHPSLRSRVGVLMSDNSFLQDLTAQVDFIPKQFDPKSVYAIADSIDEALHAVRQGASEAAGPVADLSASQQHSVTGRPTQQRSSLCGRIVARTRKKCLLVKGHRGRCRSALGTASARRRGARRRRR